jgi:hypothetical protein
MKVSELIDALGQYDPTEDLLIAWNPDPGLTARTGFRPDRYFHFVVRKHRGQLGAEGSSTIVALEVADEVVGYFKPPFITLIANTRE